MVDGRRAAILTVSDGVFAGTRTDDSGRALAELLTRHGFEIAEASVVPDERPEIEAALRRLAGLAQLVVTTGGTGLGPRDVTPEATRAAIEREAPGLAETMRAVGRLTSPMAIISRGVTGVVGGALVLNLPGSPRGAVESLETVLEVVPHALELLAGHTRHTPSQTALPNGEPAARAGERGHGHGHSHDHGHGGEGRTAPDERAGEDPGRGAVGVGPSDVTLDLARHLASGEEVLLATAIRTEGAPPCRPGQKLLLGTGGPLSGTLGCSEFDVAAAADVQDVLASGRPVLRTYHHDLGSVEVYLEPYRHRPQLVVLAATPIALWLLRWGRDLGYETILIESRPDWITPEHRQAAGRVLDSADSLPEGPTGEMEVVHTDHDAPDVARQVGALLARKPRFVGIMGSARHAGAHLTRLREMGVPAEEVTRIQSPVGLDIGARTPPEIALSILAGLLAARTGRGAGWLDGRTSH